ncbi:MAG: hypothetical protein VB035_00800 [Candidatus Fimivivens sp.]|nr:hypothetical protein [Candidatus Fimivivens sp.]
MAVSNGTLQAVFALQDNYTTAIRKIMRSQENYEKKQQQIDKATEIFQNRLDNMSGKADSASGGIGRLVGRLTALVSATYLVKKGFDAMWGSINTSAMQRTQEITFGALLNNRAAGSAVYKYVSAYAQQSMLGREDLSKGMTTFLTYSRDMSQLERMMKMSERLYAKDPTQGAEGAVFALKEILSGDTLSMRNRFNITGFNGESIRNKMSAGDVSGALDEIDAVMTKFGASQAVVDANFRGMTVQMDMFRTNLVSAFGEKATPVMERFGAMWANLNENFAAGKYEPFINMMVSGFNAVGSVLIWTAENANILIPVISGVIGAMLTFNAVQAVTNMLLTYGAIATNAAVLPFLLLTAAIAGIAVALGVANGGMDGLISKVQNVASLDTLKNQAGLQLDKLPVEISNTAPISVKGSVAIEEENLKYLIDFAGTKWFAQFSQTTVQAPVTMSNVNIAQTMDALNAGGLVAEGIVNQLAVAPEGLRL